MGRGASPSEEGADAVNGSCRQAGGGGTPTAPGPRSELIPAEGEGKAASTASGQSLAQKSLRSGQSREHSHSPGERRQDRAASGSLPGIHSSAMSQEPQDRASRRLRPQWAAKVLDSTHLHSETSRGRAEARRTAHPWQSAPRARRVGDAEGDSGVPGKQEDRHQVSLLQCMGNTASPRGSLRAGSNRHLWAATPDAVRGSDMVSDDDSCHLAVPTEPSQPQMCFGMNPMAP